MDKLFIAFIIAVSTAGFMAPVEQPCYITVDGQKCALVSSRAEAQEAVELAIAGKCPEDVLDIEMAEDIEIQEDFELLQEPVSVSAAVEKLSEEEVLTVTTTEEVNSQESIEYEEKICPEPKLNAGEIVVASKGQEGVKAVTKVLTKENGKVLSEEVVGEEVVKEPVERVVLAGVNESVSETGVSYDLSAEYSKLSLPADNVNITSHFGPRWGRMHNGTDFALSTGETIYAADDGEVYCASYCGGFGNVVKIDHGNGMQTYYAHCSELLVSAGESVTAGQPVALAGSTGNSTGPHLHFEVIINGTNMDPCEFLEIGE